MFPKVDKEYKNRATHCHLVSLRMLLHFLNYDLDHPSTPSSDYVCSVCINENSEL